LPTSSSCVFTAALAEWLGLKTGPWATLLSIRKESFKDSWLDDDVQRRAYNNLDDDSDEEGWLTILFTLI
jgi:hypothetical protein